MLLRHPEQLAARILRVVRLTHAPELRRRKRVILPGKLRLLRLRVEEARAAAARITPAARVRPSRARHRRLRLIVELRS